MSLTKFHDGWDYGQLITLAETVEAAVAGMSDPAQLLPAYQAGRLAVDQPTRRAWADVLPAAALRRFGECKEVNLLRSQAAADLVHLVEPGSRKTDNQNSLASPESCVQQTQTQDTTREQSEPILQPK